MRRVIEFFIRYTVWTNVLLIATMLFGFYSLSQLRYSFFPELQTDFITIQIPFPGASPQEVEEGVVLKIEENLDGLEGLERVTSVSRENFASVSVEITGGYDLDKVLNDVKNAVDQINSFPQNSEKPVIFEQKFRSRAVTVALYGDTDLFNLKYIAETFRDELMATPEISQVNISGLPNQEISIEVSEANLRRYQLTFDEISQAVRTANINISGGKFDTRDEEILIRAYGRNYYARELENLVVRGNPDGTVILLRDVAMVRESWEDVPNKVYYNGRNSVAVVVNKTQDEDIIAVVKKAREIAGRFNENNEAIKALPMDDSTVGLQQRIDLLTKNGLIGLLLVIVILGVFMNLRLSFWVAIGIPFSFAGMFIIASFIGLTINVISLFGMIIVVGILVDDAIVVGENIFAHYERGKPPVQAAVDGTVEMLGPVFTSVITTIVAFTPFFFLDGFLGKFIWHMAVVVIASLAFSLLEAFLILPPHLAHSKALSPEKEHSKIRQKLERGIHHMTHNFYAPLLKAALKNKWIVSILPIGLVFFTIGLSQGGFIRFTPFPFIDGDQLPINISLVSGRQEADTDAVLERIENICWELNEEMKSQREDSRDVIVGIRRQIGSNDFGESGSHTGKLILQLLDGETRNMASFQVAGRLRGMVGPVPEAQNITFGRQGFFGKPISISLLGDDLNALNTARDLMVNGMKNMPTLKDITDSNQEGRRELDIQLKPRAYALGLTLNEVARQVRQGFFGQEIQRIQRGRDEIRVWVRYQESDRAALGFLDEMRVRVPGGQEYPFSELADYTVKRGLNAINHLDKKKEIKVEANLADEQGDLPPVMAEIQTVLVPSILSQVQGVTVSYEGQSRNREKEAASMQKAFPMALSIMFILLILVFRSYLQAILIFSLIPWGVMGAAWGHGIQGVQISFLSMYGIIALSGIIINDSIVFVDQINRFLKQGQKIKEAIYNAGLSRLRPILLTTFTTALGLAPIIVETSRQAQFLVPMAVSVAYGLVFGTFVLLLVLPANFLILNDFRVWFSKLFSRLGSSKEQITPETVEPAVKELKTQVT